MKIGVFDSGVGGKTIALALEKAFPKYEVKFVCDHKNVPYGNKTKSEIIRLTNQALQPFIKNKYNIIVIACNTATAAAIDYLRDKYPHVLFVGCEPMVKTASKLTKTKIVSVFGTRSTIHSERYNDLKQKYGKGITFIEPDCSSWATMIENQSIDNHLIKTTVDNQIARHSDVIVLACTHYHWIRDLIETYANHKAIVIDPTKAIVRRVKQLTNPGTVN